MKTSVAWGAAILGLDAICVHESARAREVESAVRSFVVMQEGIKIEIIQHIARCQWVRKVQRAKVGLEEYMSVRRLVQSLRERKELTIPSMLKG